MIPKNGVLCLLYFEFKRLSICGSGQGAQLYSNPKLVFDFTFNLVLLILVVSLLSEAKKVLFPKIDFFLIFGITKQSTVKGLGAIYRRNK